MWVDFLGLIQLLLLEHPAEVATFVSVVLIVVALGVTSRRELE